MEQRQIKQYFVDKKKTAENKFNSNFKQKTLFVILLLLKYKIWFLSGYIFDMIFQSYLNVLISRDFFSRNVLAQQNFTIRIL